MAKKHRRSTIGTNPLDTLPLKGRGKRKLPPKDSPMQSEIQAAILHPSQHKHKRRRHAVGAAKSWFGSLIKKLTG